MAASTLMTAACLAALVVGAACLPTFPKTPKGQIPPTIGGYPDVICRVQGDYEGVIGDGINTTAQTGWKYSGFQSLSFSNKTAQRWRYDWSFQVPNPINPGWWTDSSSQLFETGLSGPPSSTATPNAPSYVNSYVMNPISGAWGCYHIPVPRFWASDYLLTSTAVSADEYIPRRWGDKLGGNRMRLRGGANAGKIVRLYKNTDVWFQCPRCGLITAVTEDKGRIVRQFYIQTTIDFFTDFHECRPADPTSAAWQQSFSYNPTFKATPCINILTGVPAYYDEFGPITQA